MRGRTRAARIGIAIAMGLLISISSLGISPVSATPTYYFSPDPLYAQEGQSVVLNLRIDGVVEGVTYTHVIRVKDPAGNTFSTSHTYPVPLGVSGYQIVVEYPVTFGAPDTSLQGSYTADVDRTNPPPTAQNVAKTSFTLGLTDKTAYQRSENVSMVAVGYQPSENVTINLSSVLGPVPGFPRSVRADSIGDVADYWKIPVDVEIGRYSLRINGTLTSKQVPDLWLFDVDAAQLITGTLRVAKTAYQRTLNMTLEFSAFYPDGQAVTSGQARITVRDPSGSVANVTATPNASDQSFSVSIPTGPQDEIGIWTFELEKDGLDDSYGNKGPQNKLQSSVSLTSASLSVHLSLSATTFRSGDAVVIRAEVTYPSATVLASGSVRAQILQGSRVLRDSFPLSFDADGQNWTAVVNILDSDPSGSWEVIIVATDSAAPQNQGTASLTVSNLPPPTSLATVSFGVAAAIVASTLGIVYFYRRRVLMRRVSIDLATIEREVDKITGKPFFKSIKDQVKASKAADESSSPEG